MVERYRARLGAAQETLFIPLAARARESHKSRPVLRDPKAAEILEVIDYDVAKYGRGTGGFLTVLRTAIFDTWVRAFLAEHPAGTVVEIGTGLNTRFERVDNGQVHWFDVDLPDTIDLRRKFFTDSERRRMIAASVLEDDWLDTVAGGQGGPHFFVADGVLVYLPESELFGALTRIARRFPGARIAFDTYSKKMLDRQLQMAAKRDIARWAWACDDPRSLERLGLRVVETATISRPPRRMRDGLPARYRYLLPLADPILRQLVDVTLFEMATDER
ncbi:MAG TPA: class I SAM-dependent methyltransferase [Streptosporangiaceae bacterium]